MRTTFGLLIVVLSASLARGELLSESFDEFLLGPITNHPGWEDNRVALVSNAVPGLVDNTQPYSGGNALELPWAPDYIGRTNFTIAAYTNFHHVWRWSNNPIIRVSLMLYQETDDINIGVSLHDDNGSSDVTFQCDTNTGTVVFQGVPTGVPIITGRYINIAFLYDMTNNDWALNYNWTNIVPWSGVDASSITQFNRIVLGRFFESAATEGGVWIDDLFIDVFPKPTWAWWRFGCPAMNRIVEELDHFYPTNKNTYNTHLGQGYTDPLYDGEHDMRNAGATHYPRTSRMDTALPTPVMSNWTVEAIYKVSEGHNNFSIFAWGAGAGTSDTNTLINIGYATSMNAFYVNLRDMDEMSTTYQAMYLPASIVRLDSCWHHVAVVRRGSQLICYTDYVPSYTNGITAAADGNYRFGTNCVSVIGMTLNNGNFATNVWYDEIRFSTRALDTTEFLQVGQPVITTLTPGAPDWTFDVLTISGKTYRAATYTNIFTAADAVEVTNFVARGNYSTFGAQAPDGSGPGFLRMIRDR